VSPPSVGRNDLPDLIVRSRSVVTRDGVRPAALHIRGGRITGVLELENVPEGCPVDTRVTARISSASRSGS